MWQKAKSWALVVSTGLCALSAHGTGYRLDALDPGSPGRNSYGMVLSPSGLVAGETYVQQRCPLNRWMDCLISGFQAQQLRAIWWPQPGNPGTTRPARLLNCLMPAPSDVLNGEKPCEVLAMNAQGRAVGRSMVSRKSGELEMRAVVWSTPGAQPMDLTPFLQPVLPQSGDNMAVGINEQGWILGRVAQDNGPELAFLIREGMVSVLPNMGTLRIKAKAISSNMAAGDGWFEKGGPASAIIWTIDGATTVLRTIDGNDNDIHAESVSTAGHVAGYYWAPAGRQGNRAFLWYQGHALILPTEPGFSSLAYGVNANGQTVGSHCRTDQDVHGCRAVLWVDGVRLDLNALTQVPDNYKLVQARAINDQGQITGWMVNGQQAYRAFLLTPKP